jgi:hypothetical protein
MTNMDTAGLVARLRALENELVERLSYGEIGVPEDGAFLVDSCVRLREAANAIARLTEHLVAREADLAECFRLTGADPDGNEDWRIARDAVDEVRRLRTESDKAEAALARLATMTQLAARYARHDDCCDVSPNHPGRCRCGYLALRAALDMEGETHGCK